MESGFRFGIPFIISLLESYTPLFRRAPVLKGRVSMHMYIKGLFSALVLLYSTFLKFIEISHLLFRDVYSETFNLEHGPFFLSFFLLLFLHHRHLLPPSLLPTHPSFSQTNQIPFFLPPTTVNPPTKSKTQLPIRSVAAHPSRSSAPHDHGHEYVYVVHSQHTDTDTDIGTEDVVWGGCTTGGAVFKAGYDIDIVMEGRGKESVGWMKMGQSLSWTGIVGSLRWVR